MSRSSVARPRAAGGDLRAARPIDGPVPLIRVWRRLVDAVLAAHASSVPF